MLQHYKLFPIHLVAFLLVIILLLFARYIYPKKKINPILPIVLFSMLPVISNFRVGVFESGQFKEHILVSITFYKSLSEGDFFPRWAENACSGYGCPLFNFQYLLIYYLSSLFHFIGFSFVTSMKLVMSFAYIASGVTMFLFARHEFGEKAAYTSSIFYLFAPFHLGSMHFRGSIGELISFIFIPLVFLLQNKTYSNPTSNLIFATAFSLFLLMISHQAVFLATFPIIILYLIIAIKREPSIKGALGVCIAIITGALLSSYRWVPILLERNYIQTAFVNDVEFQKLAFYLYSPFNNRFGFLFQGNNGELYPNIGYFHLGVITIAIIFLLKKKIYKKYRFYTLSLLTAIIIYFLMMLEQSRPIWLTFPIIKQIQNAWRLIIQEAFLSSTLAGLLAYHIKSIKIIQFICLLLIGSTILNWGNRSLDLKQSDSILMTQPIYKESIAKIELTTPIWVNTTSPWIGNRKTDLDAIGGKTDFIMVNRKTNFHEYVIHNTNISKLVENTYYYPGWKLYIDNVPHDYTYSEKGYEGLMVFLLDEGLHKVEFKFEETLFRKVGNFISITTLTIISFLFLKKRINNFKF